MRPGQGVPYIRDEGQTWDWILNEIEGGQSVGGEGAISPPVRRTLEVDRCQAAGHPLVPEP